MVFSIYDVNMTTFLFSIKLASNIKTKEFYSLI